MDLWADEMRKLFLIGEHGHLAMEPTSGWLTNYVDLLKAREAAVRENFNRVIGGNDGSAKDG